jgi:hypothetical protein
MPDFTLKLYHDLIVDIWKMAKQYLPEVCPYDEYWDELMDKAGEIGAKYNHTPAEQFAVVLANAVIKEADRIWRKEDAKHASD